MVNMKKGLYIVGVVGAVGIFGAGLSTLADRPVDEEPVAARQVRSVDEVFGNFFGIWQGYRPEPISSFLTEDYGFQPEGVEIRVLDKYRRSPRDTIELHLHER